VARLVVEPHRKLRNAELRDLEREAVTFLRFMAPAAESRDVEVLALAR
jgi:hypothetical protein